MKTTTTAIIDGRDFDLVNGWRYHAVSRQNASGCHDVLVYRVFPRLRRIGHSQVIHGLSRYEAERFVNAFNPADGSVLVWPPKPSESIQVWDADRRTWLNPGDESRTEDRTNEFSFML